MRAPKTEEPETPGKKTWKRTPLSRMCVGGCLWMCILKPGSNFNLLGFNAATHLHLIVVLSCQRNRERWNRLQPLQQFIYLLGVLWNQHLFKKKGPCRISSKHYLTPRLQGQPTAQHGCLPGLLCFCWTRHVQSQRTPSEKRNMALHGQTELDPMRNERWICQMKFEKTWSMASKWPLWSL